MTDLLNQSSVRKVVNEAALPAALADAGIKPDVTPAEPSADLGLVRREANGATYDFVYNRSKKTASVTLDITGTGTPYLLDTWSGRITPVTSLRAHEQGHLNPGARRAARQHHRDDGQVDHGPARSDEESSQAWCRLDGRARQRSCAPRHEQRDDRDLAG
ncbi:hypothetical protein [Aeromicrobium sp. UC242_57]|uniref:hypothetical protein n=1 Tax=Aeromicrobium sp. UC242_57 TaxID=3374624 RepID=UPI003789DC8E